jgi:putative ABC transport system substrate-binding protein
MNRRGILRALAGAATTLALPVRAQKSIVPTIGFLGIGSPGGFPPFVAAFRQGLEETGYVEGRNLAIEFRWAEGVANRLPVLAADLVRRNVAVLVATGGPGPALAAKAATSTIPIVFTLGADPVTLGLAANLGRPGGNATGVTFITGQLHAKRLELLHELVPKGKSIAVLVNPDNRLAESNAKALQDAAPALGLELHMLRAHTVQEIDAAFAAVASMRADALFVASDGFFFDRREQFGAQATRHAIPTTFDLREFVPVGGLMSYGASLAEVYRQAGVYTGRILNGAKPGDLPILQPNKIELVINLKTAKSLGLTVPQALLLRADEVIQ